MSVSITSGANGTTYNYLVSASNIPERTGTITIAGQVLTVNQASGCMYSLSSVLSPPLGAGGGGGSFDIQSGQGCAWTVSTDAPWITINTNQTGFGNGSIGYTVAANSGVARTGTINAGGQTFTVNQAGSGGKSRKRTRFF